MATDRIKIAKGITKLLVGAGVSKISADIISNNCQPTSKYQTVIVFFGSAVIGMAARDASEKYVDEKIDNLVKSVKKIKAEHVDNV